MSQEEEEEAHYDDKESSKDQKNRTYDTLVSTSVSIFLQKVELTIYWS